jgi:hypothetical protein
MKRRDGAADAMHAVVEEDADGRRPPLRNPIDSQFAARRKLFFIANFIANQSARATADISNEQVDVPQCPRAISL